MAKKIRGKVEEILKLSDEDLQKQLDESYRRLFSLRLQKETLQLTNHREIPGIKRTIARLKTFQRQRELLKASQGEAS
ncbi:MAG TPA: 50S ribosomal protein L29 [Dehalococcoidia bacterium]